MRLALARFTYWTHLLCIGFLCFGCFLPRPMLIAHLMAVPMVIVQWWLNRNQCILTQIQNRLEGIIPEDPSEGGHFISDLLARFGLQLNERTLTVVVYLPLMASFSISWMRYF